MERPKLTNTARPVKPEGRPSSYHPSYANIAYEFCLMGATYAKLADVFQVHENTICNWLNDIPTFKEAVLAGGERADAKVARSMFELSVGFEHPEEKIFYDSKTGEVVRVDTVQKYKPDGNAGYKWLMLRQRGKAKQSLFEVDWSDADKQKIELTGKDGEALIAPTIIINPVRAVERE
jgi:hypothetical protein